MTAPRPAFPHQQRHLVHVYMQAWMLLPDSECALLQSVLCYLFDVAADADAAITVATAAAAGFGPASDNHPLAGMQLQWLKRQLPC